ncbi:MAG: hypothetical protein WKG00_17860 [Polyangiaceae bacterium]
MDVAPLTALPLFPSDVRVGPVQRAGVMAMAPLFSESHSGHSERFLPPLGALKLSRVAGYGNVEVECRAEKKRGGVGILPLHVGWVQDGAQNHALCRAALLSPGEKRMFDDACCVQQAQGGYLEGREQGFFVLPLPLRTVALSMRNEPGYSKLWPQISELCKEMGLPCRGHLDQIICRQRGMLTRYASRFELLPGQTGALFFVKDRLMGIELGPTPDWFAEVWMPLVCFCYGAYAMPRERLAPAPRALDRGSVRAVRAGLIAERRAADERLWQGVRDIRPSPYRRTEEERLLDLRLYTVESDCFGGQVVEEDGRPVYASLSARPEWAAAA